MKRTKSVITKTRLSRSLEMGVECFLNSDKISEHVCNYVVGITRIHIIILSTVYIMSYRFMWVLWAILPLLTTFINVKIYIPVKFAVMYKAY